MGKLEKQQEERVLREMGECEHFRGIQHDLCKAGVNLRQLVGGPNFGWARRIPCLLDDADDCEVQCEKRSLPTRAQAEATVANDDSIMMKTIVAISAAHADAKAKGLGIGNGGHSGMSCPTGCGGALNYSVKGMNGHMHAACTTPDCVRWME